MTPGLSSFDPAEESCKYMDSIFELEHGQTILCISVRHALLPIVPFKLPTLYAPT